MKQANKAPHQQRNRYRLTTEEAGALLAYRSLPYIARRRLCSLLLRVMAEWQRWRWPGSPTTWRTYVLALVAFSPLCQRVIADKAHLGSDWFVDTASHAYAMRSVGSQDAALAEPPLSPVLIFRTVCVVESLMKPSFSARGYSSAWPNDEGEGRRSASRSSKNISAITRDWPIT